jgi:hypothetical protein
VASAVRRAAYASVPMPGPPRRASNVQQSQPLTSPKRSSALPALLALLGVVISSDASVSIADAKFTAGRIGIVVLLIPAIIRLFQRGGRILLSDFFAFATGAWMVGLAVYVDSAKLSSTCAEALEFVGGYFVARGLFFGPSGLAMFIRVLRSFAFLAIFAAVADIVSGRWIVPEILSPIFNVPPLAPQYRSGLVRAISTFSHPILFGVFCSLVATVLLYSESNARRRLLYVGVCLFGCVVSQSSAALLAVAIAVAIYAYDGLMNRYPWRWSALSLVTLSLFSVVLVSTNNPLGWILSHLTLDPESGYFRLLIWDAALDRISQAPFTGFSFSSLDNDILDSTIDAAWLVFSLRFGVPMIVLLFLTSVTALLPCGKNSKTLLNKSYMGNVSTAFTVVVVLFMFTGLTVHFWNYMWIFWGICLGIRASLREWALPSRRRLEGLGSVRASVAMVEPPKLA